MKVKIELLKEHPLNQTIYGNDEEQFQELVERIKESGWINSIIINKEFTILAGHRRYKAAKLLGYDSIDCEMVRVNPDQELEILLNSNLYREKTNVQKLKEAEFYYQIESRKARERQLSGTTLSPSRDQGRTDEIVADKVGMSRTSLRRAQEVLKNSSNIADEGLKHLIEETLNTDITSAQKLSEQPEEVIRLVQEQIDGDVSQVGGVLRTLEKMEIKNGIHLPQGKYSVIYTEYYNEENFDRCSKIPLGDLSETDSVLFLMTLPTLLEQALKLMHQWNFKYVTAFLWNKDSVSECSDFGELMLIGIKGNPPMIPLSNENQPMTEKPPIIREMIENIYLRMDKVTIRIGEGWELW